MQYNNEECVELLKKLITANRDRIAGYSEAIQLLKTDEDADLISEFELYAQQSQQFKAQLTPLVNREGDSDSNHATKRIVFTQSMAENTQRTAPHRLQVLAACEQAENELQEIYREAEGCNEIIEEQIKDLIVSQSKLLRESHSAIMNLIASEKTNN